jgi:hypothetical protein
VQALSRRRVEVQIAPTSLGVPAEVGHALSDAELDEQHIY